MDHRQSSGGQQMFGFADNQDNQEISALPPLKKGELPSIGYRFGRLEVISEPHWVVSHWKSGTAKRPWLTCRCDCSPNATIDCPVNRLKSGNTRSCGCLNKESIGSVKRTHGMAKTRLWKIWIHMRDRCNSPNNKDFRTYGARGIKVCDAWKDDFSAFHDWATANGYDETLTIERKDVDRGYEPSNCCWIAPGQQQANKTNTAWLTVFGERKYVTEWARDERCSVSYHTLVMRLRYGWLPEDAILTPKGVHRINLTRVREDMTKSSHELTDSEISSEIWCPIPDWDGYEASDMGRIRSFMCGSSLRILRPFIHKKRSRHAYYSLVNGNRRAKINGSHLVLMAFVGPRHSKDLDACHAPDPNPRNNRLSNLRWDTKTENQRDRRRLNDLITDMIKKQ